jgi:hypothetical protein
MVSGAGGWIMVLRHARWGWGLALIGCLFLPAGLRAEGHDLHPPWQGHECPRTAYSKLQYWTPEVYRLKAWVHHPWHYIYPKDLHPDMPINFHPIPYRCYSVGPREYSLDHYYPGLRLPPY